MVNICVKLSPLVKPAQQNAATNDTGFVKNTNFKGTTT